MLQEQLSMLDNLLALGFRRHSVGLKSFSKDAFILTMNQPVRVPNRTVLRHMSAKKPLLARERLQKHPPTRHLMLPLNELRHAGY